MIVLGLPDPEMALIERLGVAAGARVAYAMQDGRRVGGSTPAAICDSDGTPALDPDAESSRWHGLILVECPGADPGGHPGEVTIVDHHDSHPMASEPPARAAAASSVGQVVRLLGLDVCRECGDRLDWTDQSGPGWRPCFVHEDGAGDPYHRGPGECDGGGGAPVLGVRDDQAVGGLGTCGDLHRWPLYPGEYAEIRLTAAADHCLGAAYRGDVPGVRPEVLGVWRAETRAAFQGRPVEDILRDVEAAREWLAMVPRVPLGGVEVADMRSAGDVPELPEAAARDGVAFVAIPKPGRDGPKVVLQAAPTEAVEAFLRGEGPAAGLVRLYGAPARGFAGGYFA